MSSKIISLLEYEESEKLSKKELKELERINKLTNYDIFTITSNSGIKAKQYVGVCQIGKRTIEVMPKIFTQSNSFGEDLTEQSKIKQNLLYMLSYTKKIKIKESEISYLSKNSSLFEAIIYLFGKNLIELLKKDLIRNYERRGENTNFLKGKLLMTKHLRYNLFNKAKFYSEFDEFTEDNLLNQVFKATIDKLLRFTKNSKNFKLLTECNLILQDILLKYISLNDVEKVGFHRLNKQYEDIFNLAKILLFGNSTDLSAKNTKTYSLMFDMNKLFEEFIFEFIKKECDIKDYNIQAEKPREYIFNESPKFELKPDITISNDKKVLNIIDTKYKKIFYDKSKKYGVSTSDIYQMFVYSQIYKCKEITLLYPKFETKFEEKFQSEFNFNVNIQTVNLHIDLLNNKSKLVEELNLFLNKILK